MRLLGSLLAAAALLAIAACGKGGEAPKPGAAGAGGTQKVIGVALRTRSHDFYKDLEAGLAEEAGRRGFRLVVQAADDDLTAQARQIEDFVTKKVDAIVLIPVESNTVAAALKGAAAAKIPVFTADIAANGADVVSHVASDNHQGGRLAGEAMARFLGGKGKVVVIDQPSVSSVQDRVRGFEEAIKGHPGIEIVGKPAGGGERVKAQAVMEDALTRHADLSGAFGINDDSALGALRAVEQAGRTGLVIIGYDANPEAREAILRGSALKADVVQYPRQIGARTIDAVARHLAGEKVEKITPVEVGTVDSQSLAKAK